MDWTEEHEKDCQNKVKRVYAFLDGLMMIMLTFPALALLGAMIKLNWLYTWSLVCLCCGVGLGAVSTLVIGAVKCLEAVKGWRKYEISNFF